MNWLARLPKTIAALDELQATSPMIRMARQSLDYGYALDDVLATLIQGLQGRHVEMVELLRTAIERAPTFIKVDRAPVRCDLAACNTTGRCIREECGRRHANDLSGDG